MLHETQAIVAKDNHRFRVLLCGRRWGKTTLATKEIKAMAVQTEAKICYVAPTYQQSRDIAWELLKKELLPITIQANESRLEIRVRNIRNTESTIYLRGWESIETLRGQAFDFVILDEVAMMRNFWINWQEIIRPTLTDRKGIVMFISTPKGFNHFYDLYNLESKDPEFKSFHFSSYDNPHIPKEEIDQAKNQMTEDRFCQEYMADFRKTEGLVYKEFIRNKHLYAKLPDKEYIRILGIDFGFTAPCAILDIKKDKDGHYWIDSEWYKRGKTDEEIAEMAMSYKAELIYPDPEAPEKVEIMRRRGLNVREVVKGKDSISTGISKLRELLKQGRIHIQINCVNLIYEFETYSYPEKRPDNNEPEKPIKENDHALDALRYVVMMNDERFIERTPEEIRAKYGIEESNYSNDF